MASIFFQLDNNLSIKAIHCTNLTLFFLLLNLSSNNELFKFPLDEAETMDPMLLKLGCLNA